MPRGSAVSLMRHATISPLFSSPHTFNNGNFKWYTVHSGAAGLWPPFLQGSTAAQRFQQTSLYTFLKVACTFAHLTRPKLKMAVRMCEARVCFSRGNWQSQ